MFWSLRKKIAQWLIDPKGLAKAREGNLPSINLLGDRDIERSWVMANIPETRGGNALDFGNGGGPLGLAAALRGYTVTAVDLRDIEWPYEHSNLRFIRGDVLKLDLPGGSFDLVINSSTIEHVGMSGRYGVDEALSEGDMMAMRHLRKLMKPKGIMLVTVPVGQDAIFPPMCRVYGAKRLPCLLEGFEVCSEKYWIKDDQNRWIMVERSKALVFETHGGDPDPLRNWMGIGCFVLRAS